MKLLVLVQFSPRGQVLAYTSDDMSIQPDNCVLVDTGQGLAAGGVVAVKKCEDNDLPDGMLPVDHIATPEELLKDGENRELMGKAFKFCVNAINELGLDMKLITVESLFDLSKILFTFSAPTRVDFRNLVKALVRQFHTRIELRQVGVRHEMQMMGSIGACGMVCCCRRYMHDFLPVTIKMAKEQNVFLNPSKISGICGRLLCCLAFEQDSYEKFNRVAPKLGKHYTTKKGLLKVLRVNMFRNTVSVLDEAEKEHDFTMEEWGKLSPQRLSTGRDAASPPPDTVQSNGYGYVDEKDSSEVALRTLSDDSEFTQQNTSNAAHPRFTSSMSHPFGHFRTKK